MIRTWKSNLNLAWSKRYTLGYKMQKINLSKKKWNRLCVCLFVTSPTAVVEWLLTSQRLPSHVTVPPRSWRRDVAPVKTLQKNKGKMYTKTFFAHAYTASICSKTCTTCMYGVCFFAFLFVKGKLHVHATMTSWRHQLQLSSLYWRRNACLVDLDVTSSSAGNRAPGKTKNKGIHTQTIFAHSLHHSVFFVCYRKTTCNCRDDVVTSPTAGDKYLLTSQRLSSPVTVPRRSWRRRRITCTPKRHILRQIKNPFTPRNQRFPFQCTPNKMPCCLPWTLSFT